MTDSELKPIASFEARADAGGRPAPLFSPSGDRIYLALTDQFDVPALTLLDVPSSQVSGTLTLASRTSNFRAFSGPLATTRDGSTVLVTLALLPWGRLGGELAAGRSLVIRYSWEGDLLSVVPISIGSTFPSPDGTLIVGDQLTQPPEVVEDKRYAPRPTMLVADTASAVPVFRLEGAYGNYGDRLAGTRWLADSSGFVALLGSDTGAPAYGIVNRDGSIRPMLPPAPGLGHGPWYRDAAVFAPLPAPDNPALFAYGRASLFDSERGRWRFIDFSGERGPDHLDPWGETSDELVFALPHRAHPFGEPPELGAFEVGYAPFPS